jgi:hypothetical protein
MAKNKRPPSGKKTKESSTAPKSSSDAVPPPDDPLRRATEFEPDREFKSKEMARKRLEAIKHTREMPTAQNELPNPDSPDSPKSGSE